MDNKPEYMQAHQMSSSELKSVGLPETAKAAKARENQTIRRRLAKGAVGVGIAAGLIGMYAAASESDYQQAKDQEQYNQNGPTLIDRTNLNTVDQNINIPPADTSK